MKKLNPLYWLLSLWRMIRLAFATTLMRKTKYRSIASASTGKVITVRMGDRDVVVQSLAFGFYMETVPRMKALIAVVGEAQKQGLSLEETVQVVLQYAKKDFLYLLQELTGLEVEYIIRNVTPAQMFRYVRALIEVNEYEYALGEVKTFIGEVVRMMMGMAQDLQEAKSPSAPTG
ncbi:hypothetical protein [Tumebacillus permanentifrigoris]|nr:hypothetical protein [Tumebacillus permanentifrigoris]